MSWPVFSFEALQFRTAVGAFLFEANVAMASGDADQLMEGESYDVSDKTTFTREVDVRLDSPNAEGRQTEIVVVTGLRKHEGAIVPFDARFTLECRVRRE
jgi:hypothetical protein